MSRFNRSNFLRSEVVDGKFYYSLVNSYFDDCFIITKPPQYYCIEQSDVQAPDILSLKIYGKQDYWWILCKLNNVYDVWNDLVPGKIITVPAISDIEDFYSRVKSKKKDENKN
jgi:hypothetical protein